MLLQRLVEVHDDLRRTRSRNAKRDAVAELLAEAEPSEVALVATYLSGRLTQRRTGLGWQSWRDVPPPAGSASLTLTDVDRAFETVSRAQGAGSRAARAEELSRLLALATVAEQGYLRALALGEVRQGALDSVLLDAVAAAASVPVTAVRRAAMFTPDSGEVAQAALSGGETELTRFGLEPGRPLRPMLASPAPDLAEALASVPAGDDCFVDRKLDGVRLQVHRVGEEVAIYTRSLDDITERLPGVVDAVRALDVERVVLDGEVLLVKDGRPRPFQETASAVGRTGALAEDLHVTWFDLLHHDGEDLVDTALTERLRRLDAVAPADQVVQRLHLTDPDEKSEAADAAGFFEATIRAGHEGVVVKHGSSPYAAGRRGSSWVKVKPRHTLDLVVVAVEWGSGRRQGKLSNIHLAARGEDGEPVMLGKTFKGMTDEMLAWQTERFLELETRRDHHVVHVRPEQVVEIALDGVQQSSRYPGGVALRFARVLRYREDKPVSEIDTLDTVRSML